MATPTPAARYSIRTTASYSSKVQLADGGKKLNVRGYIGVPMLGRSQTWVRQE